jgi:hypothetical protein
MRSGRILVGTVWAIVGSYLASTAGQAPAVPLSRPGPKPPGCSQPRPATPPAPHPDEPITRLLSAYATGGRNAIARTITTANAFDDLRKNLAPMIESWKSDPHRIQSVFLLELADHAVQHHWFNWLDVLDLARRFVMSRRDPHGVNADDDAFELIWHKTAAALLALSSRPEVLEDCGVMPLLQRIAPEPFRSADRQLVDPWIALMQAEAEEGWTTFDHSLLPTRGPTAVRLFDEAAKYPATRGEALVRKAQLLIRSGLFPEAVGVLEEAGDPAADVAVRYWARLFRGRALEGVGRLDEAAKAYADALVLIPRAQSPSVALMALAFSRDRLTDALQHADDIRTASGDAVDPWWAYDHGDGRFYESRLAVLREMSRR